jgi:Domain of unknown function (DUF4136)
MRLAGLALALASIAVLSCANMRVRTDYDTAIDFAPLQTYAWLDPPLREASREEGGQGGDPFTQNTLVDKRVRDEVNAWLSSHGYRAAGEGEEPDFLVRYELVSREVERDSPVFVTGGFGHYGYGYGGGSGIGYGGSTTYQEGTLILDVIDPTTQQIAWRGWGTSQARDLQPSPERLRKTVAAILARFPPKPKADRRAE